MKVRQEGDLTIKENFNEAGQYHSIDDKPAYMVKDSTGEVLEAGWYSNGVMSRQGKPAYYLLKDGVQRFEFRINGQLHRNEDSPALIAKWGDGYSVREWYQHGQLHREGDEPARVMALENGDITEWFKNGQLHRENNQPASINTVDDITQYYFKGQLHNPNGWAYIKRDLSERGNIVEEVKNCIHGKFHNEGGWSWAKYETEFEPSRKRQLRTIYFEKYALNGKEVSSAEMQKYVQAKVRAEHAEPPKKSLFKLF